MYSTKKQNRKIYTILILLLLEAALCLCLIGCIEHGFPHSLTEVKEYLEQTFPGEEITVSRRHYKEPNEDGGNRMDRVWDCWFTDLPEVVFQVRSSWKSSTPVPNSGYRLSCNARPVLTLHYLEQYQTQGGVLDAWIIDEGSLEMKYSSMAEIYPASEQLSSFFDWYILQPHAGEPPSAVCDLDEGGLPLPPVSDSRSYFRLHGQDSFYAYDQMTEVCAAQLKQYYAYYAIPSPDFSAEELSAFSRKEWPWPRYQSLNVYPYYLEIYPYPYDIRQGQKQLPRETFAGIGIHSEWISYGGLYEVLTRLELNPEGTPEQFTVIGTDGCLYEFSYAFYQEDGEERWWYYKKDGEIVEGDYARHLGRAPLIRLYDMETFPAVTGVNCFFDRA